MRATRRVMPLMRKAREVANPALRVGLSRVQRKAWPGRVMNYLGSGAPIMVGRGETAFLCGIFQEATVLDFATTVGQSGRVVVMEANPDNVERLRRNVSSANVEIVNSAVWHKDVELEFELGAVGDAQHYNRVRDAAMQPFPVHMVAAPKILAVQGETIATLADRLGIDHIDHLNLTVNGAELEAFRGDAGSTLASRVSRIYAHTEVPQPGREFGQRLRHLGYATTMSKRLNSRNPKIDLRRIYAWRI